MLLLFQLLFTVFAVFALTAVFKKQQGQLLGTFSGWFWVLFWIVADAFVWWPNATNTLAHAFGIGRGADLITYVSVIVLFYLVFQLHIKIESIGREVTQVIRDRAIEQGKKNH